MLDGRDAWIVALETVERGKPEQLVRGEFARLFRSPRSFRGRLECRTSGVNAGIVWSRGRRSFFDPLREWILRAPQILADRRETLVRAAHWCRAQSRHSARPPEDGRSHARSPFALRESQPRLLRARSAMPLPAHSSNALNRRKRDACLRHRRSSMSNSLFRRLAADPAVLNACCRRIEDKVLPIPPRQGKACNCAAGERRPARRHRQRSARSRSGHGRLAVIRRAARGSCVATSATSKDLCGDPQLIQARLTADRRDRKHLALQSTPATEDIVSAASAINGTAAQSRLRFSRLRKCETAGLGIALEHAKDCAAASAIRECSLSSCAALSDVRTGSKFNRGLHTRLVAGGHFNSVHLPLTQAPAARLERVFTRRQSAKTVAPAFALSCCTLQRPLPGCARRRCAFKRFGIKIGQFAGEGADRAIGQARPRPRAKRSAARLAPAVSSNHFCHRETSSQQTLEIMQFCAACSCRRVRSAMSEPLRQADLPPLRNVRLPLQLSQMGF